MKNLKIKVLKEFDGHKAGEEVSVPCDQHSIPLARSWRRRLKDAERDKCCEVVVPKTRGKSKKSTGDK